MIKMGHVFESNDWDELPEGYGVVVVVKNGKEVAYGDVLPNEGDILCKNFVGAKFMYGANKVYLIRRESGVLIRHQ